ncbi:MAG: DoxX family protein [Candidatus Wallbacteria bacterium]|nr:DoxX family protein [Candidatus Wallbacteria bacterium]
MASDFKARVLDFLFRTDEDKNWTYALLRVFVGGVFIYHGFPKLFQNFDGFSGMVRGLGFPAPGFFAFMAALAEFGGGVLLIPGLFTRVCAFLMGCTMFVAAFIFHAGHPFAKKELAIAYLICSILFFFKGAGYYSLDRMISRKKVRA